MGACRERGPKAWQTEWKFQPHMNVVRQGSIFLLLISCVTVRLYPFHLMHARPNYYGEYRK
jgi:hypothetical protein